MAPSSRALRLTGPAAADPVSEHRCSRASRACSPSHPTMPEHLLELSLSIPAQTVDRGLASSCPSHAWPLVAGEVSQPPCPAMAMPGPAAACRSPNTAPPPFPCFSLSLLLLSKSFPVMLASLQVAKAHDDISLQARLSSTSRPTVAVEPRRKQQQQEPSHGAQARHSRSIARRLHRGNGTPSPRSVDALPISAVPLGIRTGGPQQAMPPHQ